ncbi:hypothetical protein V8F06_007537 [Rhypophila decipiens]
MEQITLSAVLQALMLIGLISNLFGQWLQKHVSISRLLPWKLPKSKDASPSSEESISKPIVESILSTSKGSQHPCAHSLATLVQQDGAGCWPPKTNHAVSSWPAALRPYRQIWDDLSPLIPTPNSSRLLDDDANKRRIDHFRCLMRENLAMRIDIGQVMEDLEDDTPSRLGQDTVNALYCCLAMLRHGYRWAVIPAVKVAQLETALDIPSELGTPWKLLQRRYGLKAESSNLTGTILHNFTNEGEFVFNINVGMPEHLQKCEEHFCRISYSTEALALPIYNEMVQAIVAFDRSDKAATLRHVENIYPQLRHVLRVFYDTMHDGHVPRSLWLSHVQSFQAWGLDRVDAETGEKVRDNGVSGSHLLFFQALDSLLGIDRYLSRTDLLNSIPVRQRAFCEALKKHSPRGRLSSGRAAGVANDGSADLDPMIERGFSKIAERLKVFRAAHKTRVMPYLSVPAPERLPMTAGRSVLKGGGDNLANALETLRALLVKRHNDTV